MIPTLVRAVNITFLVACLSNLVGTVFSALISSAIVLTALAHKSRRSIALLVSLSVGHVVVEAMKVLINLSHNSG